MAAVLSSDAVEHEVPGLSLLNLSMSVSCNLNFLMASLAFLNLEIQNAFIKGEPKCVFSKHQTLPVY